MEKHAEDFGQTLGTWGVGDGPYMYWPIIGPRTTRDTFGWAVDSYVDPVMRVDDVALRNSLAGVRFIDLRASLLPSDNVVEPVSYTHLDVYKRQTQCCRFAWGASFNAFGTLGRYGAAGCAGTCNCA